MSTAQHIIERAFQKIGVKAAESPVTASELEDGLDLLNDLIAQWDATGTLKGVAPVQDVGTDLMEPRYATKALKANLAIELATEYKIELDQGMIIAATNSFNEMVKASIDLSNVEFPSTLPIGSGNRDQYGTGYDRDYFPENSKRNF